jgi:hypothetical protein
VEGLWVGWQVGGGWVGGVGSAVKCCNARSGTCVLVRLTRMWQMRLCIIMVSGSLIQAMQ